MAEGAGFEPARRFITVYTLSRRAPSTARPPLPERGREISGAAAGAQRGGSQGRGGAGAGGGGHLHSRRHIGVASGMVARVRTVAFHGVEVVEVEVQATIASGLPAFALVGLPDKAVAESRERVRAALASLGLALPPRRITVNLAPADVAKEGSHFDLPIALALLAAMEVLPADELQGYTALGEVALD